MKTVIIDSKSFKIKKFKDLSENLLVDPQMCTLYRFQFIRVLIQLIGISNIFF